MKLDRLRGMYEYAVKTGAPNFLLRNLAEEIYQEEIKLGKHRQPPRTLHSGSSGTPGNGPLGAAPITLAQFAALYDPGQFTFPKPPEPVKETGIRAGEIIAWRVWIIRDGLLGSTYTKIIWSPGEIMKAHGDPASEDWHKAKALGLPNHVGIFAWKTEELAQDHKSEVEFIEVTNRMSELFFQTKGEFFMPIVKVLIGQVLLWGSIVEHEHGYRAEFAKVHKIFDRGLAATYGVPYE